MLIENKVCHIAYVDAIDKIHGMGRRQHSYMWKCSLLEDYTHQCALVLIVEMSIRLVIYQYQVAAARLERLSGPLPDGERYSPSPPGSCFPQSHFLARTGSNSDRSIFNTG